MTGTPDYLTTQDVVTYALLAGTVFFAVTGLLLLRYHRRQPGYPHLFLAGSFIFASICCGVWMTFGNRPDFWGNLATVTIVIGLALLFRSVWLMTRPYSPRLLGWL